MPKPRKFAGTAREPYTSLKPRIKALKESTIRKKWKKLPTGTQVKVADLLRTVGRPALIHGNTERRNVETQVAVAELVSKLTQRLPHMPFPPGTDELSFDFESIINRQRVLEEQLTANTHTIALLDAEVGGETNLLGQEKAELDALERELAHCHGSNKKQEQRLHPFAQASGLSNPQTMSADYETRCTTKIPATTLSKLEHDKDAKSILDQLRHHLDSLQKNIEGTENIAAALTSSQASLGLFSWRNLERAEYRRVYGTDAA